MTNANETNDLGDDLEITSVRSRPGANGNWIKGKLNGHRFEALVFADHAESAEYEIDQSRISKLWIQRLADKKEVYNWDRGLDVPAANKTVQAIVDFLAAGLAETIYAK